MNRLTLGSLLCCAALLQAVLEPANAAPSCVERYTSGGTLKIPEQVCTYQAPHYRIYFLNSKRLDWCRVWGKECGKPAADAYCKSYGHIGVDTLADAYARADEVGPTVIISTRQICNNKSCDGFKYIRCLGPPGGSGFYRHPRLGAERLDWCRTWGKECGAAAANAFCQKMMPNTGSGFWWAGDFGFAADVGPTRIIGTGQACKNKTCDGFEYIRCQYMPH